MFLSQRCAVLTEFGLIAITLEVPASSHTVSQANRSSFRVIGPNYTVLAMAGYESAPKTSYVLHTCQVCRNVSCDRPARSDESTSVMAYLMAYLVRAWRGTGRSTCTSHSPASVFLCVCSRACTSHRPQGLLCPPSRHSTFHNLLPFRQEPDHLAF